VSGIARRITIRWGTLLAAVIATMTSAAAQHERDAGKMSNIQRR
jgi:hypothetical protein